MKATKSKRDPTNKSESETIVVETTREQAYAVMNACELHADKKCNALKKEIERMISHE